MQISFPRHFLPIGRWFSIAVSVGTLMSGLSFWIVFRIIFPRLVTITASPLTAGVNVLTPIILFGIFVWCLTLTIIFVQNRQIRWLVFAGMALFYVPMHWSNPRSLFFSVLGIFVTQVLYDWSYHSDIANQKNPQWGRTVLTSGTFPIMIFSITISAFYQPLYEHAVVIGAGFANNGFVQNATQLGYFFEVQMFLIFSTLISAILVSYTKRIVQEKSLDTSNRNP